VVGAKGAECGIPAWSCRAGHPHARGVDPKVKEERRRWREEFEARQKREREAEERAREFARRGEVIAKAA